MKRRSSVFVLCAISAVSTGGLSACGDDSASDGTGGSSGTLATGTASNGASTSSSSPSGSGSGGGDDTSSGTGAGNPSQPDYAECGGAIFDADGNLDAAEYARQARLWDAATIDCRLGPTFDELHGDVEEDRPTAWEPPHDQPSGYLCPFSELSGECANGNCDYGSTSGQVLYAPDDAAGTGVDRVQNYAYENGHICESIHSGGWLGGPHPDPGLTTWSEALGRPVLLPNGFAQTEFIETNAGVMIFPDGLVGATGNQTAGDTKPYFELPPNKVPTAVSVSTANEFAFVTVWDTDEQKGQVAVFALRSVKPEAFTVPYYALFNEAGFVAIHLMGYVDLPDMRTPTAIAVSGDNGNTPGGHVPGFEFGNQEDPEQNFLTNLDARAAFAREDYERRVPMSGQAIIASRWEGKVTFLDLRPLAQFVREVYFGPDDDLRAQAANQTEWPFTFETNPEAMPVVVTTVDVDAPTTVRVGNQGSSDPANYRSALKAWVGNVAGEITAFDLSAFAHDAPRPLGDASVSVLGSVQAGANITSMTRVSGSAVLVASRGDRAIRWVGLAEEAPTSFAVLRELRDTRFDDPVLVDASDRGPVVTIGDFHGKQLLNFRVGRTEDNGGKPPANYGCGPEGADTECADFEFGGGLELPGQPFFVGTTNVN